MKRIVADPRKCLACRTCEWRLRLAHAESEDLVQGLSGRSGPRPAVYIQAAGQLAVPLAVPALRRRPLRPGLPHGGAFPVERRRRPCWSTRSKCIGCEFCVQVCPFGVIRVASDRKAIIKCDLCAARLARGLEPACVASCPVRALAFEEIKEDAARRRLQTALRLASGESA